MGFWDFLRQKPVESSNFSPDFNGWLLIPLGNPGDEYALTRHNLGRLLLQRWMNAHCLKPGPIHHFPSGTLYHLNASFMALVPGTYMNFSGQVIKEALSAGFQASRFICIYDDKDLPLGSARFRLEGSSGGHNGMANVISHLDSDRIARLRLGIGPFSRPLHEFVLQSWTDEEWPKVEALDEPFSHFLEELAQCQDLTALLAKVNQGGFWKLTLENDPEDGLEEDLVTEGSADKPLSQE